MPIDPSDRAAWPNLRDEDFVEISEETSEYNCIAHAAGFSNSWWWPIQGYYWPSGVPKEQTLDAFRIAYATLGYQLSADGRLQPGIEKIAIYVNANAQPTHAARQLEDGRWTSKLGGLIDIEHTDIGCLEGGDYGTVGMFLERARA